MLADVALGLRDPRELETHDFVRAIAAALEEALDRYKFHRLVVVAPPAPSASSASWRATR
jgi:protein required for attachment to host cells